MQFLKNLKRKVRKFSFTKTISVLTAICLITSVVGSQAVYASMPLPSAMPITNISNDISQTLIPFNLGRITEAFYANKGDIVINIQDLHSHEQTQRNISTILSILDSKYNLDNIYIEGATKSLNTEWLSNIQDSRTKQQVLDNLLKSGRLTGSEYFAVNANKNTILKGLEDPALYTQNFKRLNDIYSQKSNIQNTMTILKNVLDSKSEQYYSKENKEINKVIKDHIDGKTQTDKYIEFLLKKAQKANINLTKYTSIIKFAQVITKQKLFDTSKLNGEIKSILSKLKEQLSFKEYKLLIEKSTKKELEVTFYFELVKKAKELDILTKGNYKNTVAFVDYLLLNQDLNIIELSNNERLLVQELHNKFATTENEKNIYFLQDYLESLSHYLTNKMTATEYEFFSNNLEKFKTLWAQYIDIDNLTNISQYLDFARDFYNDNLERNRFFVKNVLGQMPKQTAKGLRIKSNINHKEKVLEAINNGQKIHVVVTGGFHTNGFSKLLEDKNINYIVITPTITGDTTKANELYEKIFNEQYDITNTTFANRPITEIVSLLNKGPIQDIRVVGNGVEIVFQNEIVSLSELKEDTIDTSVEILSQEQAQIVASTLLDIQEFAKTTRENAKAEQEGVETVSTLDLVNKINSEIKQISDQTLKSSIIKKAQDENIEISDNLLTKKGIKNSNWYKLLTKLGWINLRESIVVVLESSDFMSIFNEEYLNMAEYLTKDVSETAREKILRQHDGYGEDQEVTDVLNENVTKIKIAMGYAYAQAYRDVSKFIGIHFIAKISAKFVANITGMKEHKKYNLDIYKLSKPEKFLLTKGKSESHTYKINFRVYFKLSNIQIEYNTGDNFYTTAATKAKALNNAIRRVSEEILTKYGLDKKQLMRLTMYLVRQSLEQQSFDLDRNIIEVQKQTEKTVISKLTDKQIVLDTPKHGEYKFNVVIPGINDSDSLSAFQKVYAKSPREAVRNVIVSMCMATENGVLTGGIYKNISFSKEHIDEIYSMVSQEYSDSKLQEIVKNLKQNNAPALNDGATKQVLQQAKKGEQSFRVIIPGFNDRQGLEEYQYVYAKDKKDAIEKAVLAIIKARERDEIRGGYYNFRTINAGNKQNIIESILDQYTDLDKIVSKEELSEFDITARKLIQPISNIISAQYPNDAKMQQILQQLIEDTSRMLEKGIRTEDQIKDLLKQFEDILNGNIDEEFMKQRAIKFGTAGARGAMNIANFEKAGTITDDTIDFYTAIIIAQSISDFINSQKDLPKTVFLQCDSRYLGTAFNIAMARVFEANGIQVYEVDNPLGTVPTPTGSFFLKDLYENGNAVKYGLPKGTTMAVSINVTASHNPGRYNGFKINMKDGAQFPSTKEVSKYIADIQSEKTKIKISPKENIKLILGTSNVVAGKTITTQLNPTEKAHVEYLIDTFKTVVDLENVDISKINLIINGNNSVLVPELKALCEYFGLSYGSIPKEGRDVAYDAKKPEPNDKNMEDFANSVASVVIDGKVVFGIASDPDGDRFCIIDSDGTFINPNQIGLVVLNERLANIQRQIEENQSINTSKEFEKFMGVTLKSHVTSPELEVLAKRYSKMIVEIAKSRLTAKEFEKLSKKIAENNGFFAVENLSVGWKNIANKQKEIEKEGKTFIAGIESSGGLSLGVYDKDGALATVLPVLIASKKGMSFKEILSEIHALTEYESIFNEDAVELDNKAKQEFLDWVNSIKKLDKVSQLSVLKKLLASLGIDVDLADAIVWENEGLKIAIKDQHYDSTNVATMFIAFRASGTEPKIRVYAETTSKALNEVYTLAGARIVKGDYKTIELPKTKTNKKFILLGGPGAGKGTFSQQLVDKYETAQISAGNLLRFAAKNNPTIKAIIDSGQLVSDELVMGLVRDEIARLQAKGIESFIFDGFPRTAGQAKSLIEFFKEQGWQNDLEIIHLDVPLEEIQRRLAGRVNCDNKECGASYNLNDPAFAPTISADGSMSCPKCGSSVSVRADDTPEGIENRYNIYKQNIAPLMNVYIENGLTVKSVETIAEAMAIVEQDSQVQQTRTPEVILSKIVDYVKAHPQSIKEIMTSQERIESFAKEMALGKDSLRYDFTRNNLDVKLQQLFEEFFEAQSIREKLSQSKYATDRQEVRQILSDRNNKAIKTLIDFGEQIRKGIFNGKQIKTVRIVIDSTMVEQELIVNSLAEFRGTNTPNIEFVTVNDLKDLEADSSVIYIVQADLNSATKKLLKSKTDTDFVVDSKDIFDTNKVFKSNTSSIIPSILPAICSIGYDNFMDLLDGANVIDTNAQQESNYLSNVVMMMTILNILSSKYLGIDTNVILPYNNFLYELPKYIQGLMKNNGVFFGQPGTNGQHSFYQELHQGTFTPFMTFIAFAQSSKSVEDYAGNMITSQLKLDSNVFAQADAFAFGLTREEVIADLQKEGKTKAEIAELLEHKVFLGNRPSNVLSFSKLTPTTLGSIISIFENMEYILSLPEIKNIPTVTKEEKVEDSEFTGSQEFKDLQATKGDEIATTTQTTLDTQVGNNKVTISSNISNKLVTLLIKLFVRMNVKTKINNMFTGVKINWTEKRAVLHSALRNVNYINGVFSPKSSIYVDGKDVMPNVAKTLNKMKGFTDQLISGQWQGVTGKKITDVVSIGIGGSDLGPKMVTNTLSQYRVEGAPTLHFVSNVDPNDINSTLEGLGLNPETTLFIIESKTFTTDETISNAKLAKEWMISKLGTAPEVISKHFVAVSTNKEEVSKFGIDTNNMFEFWDWVGGRYSVWSAVGLPVMCSIGADNFAQFLAGGSASDTDLKNAIANDTLDQNISMIMAMTDIYNINILGQTNRAIQSTGLKLFVDHIQQLYMESLGKQVNGKNKRLPYHTGAKILESNGSNISDKVIQDTISGKESLGENYREGMLSYNIGLSELNPETLGALLALYENMVAIEGAVWDINAFDQWGVQLGKILAKGIYSAFLERIKDIGSKIKENLSTSKLINFVVNTRKTAQESKSNLDKLLDQLTDSQQDIQLKADVKTMLDAGFKQEYIENLLNQYIDLRNGIIPATLASKTNPIKFGTAGVRGIMGEEIDFLDVAIITQAISNVIENIAQTQNIKKEDIKILVGGDSRFLSKQFAEIVSKILAANGINVILSSDDIPSPTISYYTREEGFTLSINITASHNPKEHNGYKITLGDGGQAGSNVTTMIENEINNIQNNLTLEGTINIVKQSNKVTMVDDVKDKFINAFIKMITSIFGINDEVKLNEFKQKTSQWTVVADPKNGATKKYYYEILKYFGFNVVMMNDSVDPTFGGQKPEPSFENTKQLREKVSSMTQEKLLGISTDVDGDRFAVVDRDGNFITANNIGTILLKFRLQSLFDNLVSDLQNAQDNTTKQKEILEKFLSRKIVVPRNCATTHVLDDLAANMINKYFKILSGMNLDSELVAQFRNSVNVKEVNVGFKYFAQAKHEAEDNGDLFLLGVESSGGISIAEWIYDKCGFLANLMLLFVLVVENKQPQEIMNEVYSDIGYEPQGIETSIKFRELVVKEGTLTTPEEISAEAKSRQESLMSTLSQLKQNESMESIRNLFTNIDSGLVIKEIRTNDGIKIVFENGSWLLIRPSGTEPIVRIFDETKGDKELSEKIVKFVTENGGETLKNRVTNAINNIQITAQQAGLQPFKTFIVDSIERLQRLTYSVLFKDNMEYTIVAGANDLSRLRKAEMLSRAGIKVNLVLTGNTSLIQETNVRLSTENGELAFCLFDKPNENLTIYGFDSNYYQLTDNGNVSSINEQEALIAMLKHINNSCDKSIKILDLPKMFYQKISASEVETATQEMFSNIGIGKSITRMFAEALRKKLATTDDMIIKPSLVASNLSAEDIDTFGIEQINRLVEQGVTTIILSANDDLLQKKSETIKDLLQLAHNNGLKVMFNYSFDLESIGVDNFASWMSKFNKDIQQFKENGGIDGLQLDLSNSGDLANTFGTILALRDFSLKISEQNVGSFLSVKMPSNIIVADYGQIFKEANIKLVVDYDSTILSQGVSILNSENIIINISADKNGFISTTKLSEIFEKNKVSMISFDSSILEAIDTEDGFSFAEMSITKLITSLFETTPDGQILKGRNKGRNFVANRELILTGTTLQELYQMYISNNFDISKINEILETTFKENVSQYEIQGFIKGVLEVNELRILDSENISFDNNEYKNLLMTALIEYRTLNEQGFDKKILDAQIEDILDVNKFRDQFRGPLVDVHNILVGFDDKVDTTVSILATLKDNPELTTEERRMVLEGLLLLLLGFARQDTIDVSRITSTDDIANIKAILSAA